MKIREVPVEDRIRLVEDIRDSVAMRDVTRHTTANVMKPTSPGPAANRRP